MEEGRGLAVRAATHFVVLSRDSSTWRETVLAAAHACASAAERFRDAGYATQTLRVVTNPFGEFLDLSTDETAVAGMQVLRGILTCEDMPQGTRVRFALGEARTMEEVRVVPALIRSAADLANCCVNVACDAMGVPDAAMTRAAAECCAALARTTPGGEGNFNFTANFNSECQTSALLRRNPLLLLSLSLTTVAPLLYSLVAPGCPYFPAAYNGSGCEPGFSAGLEYPGLMVQTLAALPKDAPQAARVAALRAAVAPHVSALLELCVAHAASSGYRFLGFDTSAAPSKDTASMAAVCSGMGLPHFGAAGTVQCAALLTRFGLGVAPTSPGFGTCAGWICRRRDAATPRPGRE